MLTRSGIAYNLYSSPYILQVDKIKFIFSSEIHKEKFAEKYKLNRIEQNSKFEIKYGFYLKLNLLCDLMLYLKIETRGFLIQLESGEYVCRENLILDGENLTLKNLTE